MSHLSISWRQWKNRYTIFGERSAHMRLRIQCELQELLAAVVTVQAQRHIRAHIILVRCSALVALVRVSILVNHKLFFTTTATYP